MMLRFSGGLEEVSGSNVLGLLAIPVAYTAAYRMLWLVGAGSWPQIPPLISSV